MKAIISSFGSSGDFNPCLGLGRALQKKHVEVIFLSNPFYEKKIIQAGLRFYPAGEFLDVFDEIRGNPNYLHALKGPKAVWKLVLKTIPVMYDAMKQLINKESPDFIVAHLLEYGSMLAAIEQSIPYATLSPTPMGWFSTQSPGNLTYMECPLWLRSLLAQCLNMMMNIGFKYSLKPRCRKIGLPQEFDGINEVFGKAFFNLGLWSKMLRSNSMDDPPHSKICGFIRDKDIKDWQDVPNEIVRLFMGDKQPVVVALGSTASLHGHDIYQNTAKACKEIDWSCLLIGNDLGKLADPAMDIHTLDFAPYGWAFPRAGLIIHHGGVNTTAESLRAGVPSLVVPHAYDQFDNATRTQHMGVSYRLKVSKVTVHSLITMLKKMLSNSVMHQKAQVISQKLIAEADGGEVASEALIQFIMSGDR